MLLKIGIASFTVIGLWVVSSMLVPARYIMMCPPYALMGGFLLVGICVAHKVG